MALPRVLIIGSSFIRRLRDYSARMGSKKVNPELGLGDQLQVFWVGVSGATVESLDSDKSAMRWVFTQVKPQVVVVQLGSNDLNPRRLSDEDRLLTEREFAFKVGGHLLSTVEEWGLEGGFRQSVVCEVLPRKDPCIHTEDVPAFNRKVEYLNHYMETCCETNPGVKFYTHKAFHSEGNLEKAIDPEDGVHLTEDFGLHRYYRSIRGAVLHGVRSAYPPFDGTD